MIPYDDRDALSALAGEYVLGVLDVDRRHEIEAALAVNAELREAVAFWDVHLAPLSGLAVPADPPADTWERISARLALSGRHLPAWWHEPAPWRWATLGLAVLAAVLLLMVARPAPAPSYVAVLEAPKVGAAAFVVTGGHRELIVRMVAGAPPPSEHVFEVWAIYPRVSRPQAIGTISERGILRVDRFPVAALTGATIAVSVEQAGGSPTGQPTSAFVYLGQMKETI